MPLTLTPLPKIPLVQPGDDLPGILLGPFVGAVVFEMAGGREIKGASKAGVV